MASPNPIDNAEGDDKELDGLREARVTMALKARTQRISSQLADEWDEWRAAVEDGRAAGLSPVATLKLEALACIAALSDFHCSMAHQLIDAQMHEAAHGWALDEGALNVAFDVLSGVNTRDI